MSEREVDGDRDTDRARGASTRSEDEKIRLVSGQLIVPNSMLSDLRGIQRSVRNDPTIFDYILHEDSRLASAICAEDTALLAEYLFAGRERNTTMSDDEKQRNATIAKSKHDARVRYPALRREEERRSRIKITVIVNGYETEALVDTGAECSIATSRMIEQCHLHDLVDKSYKGTVYGMGSQKIIGKIHSVVMTVNETAFPLSLIIVEHQMSSPFLLGLDMLWRHKAVIDLAERTLRFGSEKLRIKLDRVRLTDRLESESVESSTAVCHVCKRRFKSAASLRRHETESEMHKANVAKIIRAHDCRHETTERTHEGMSSKDDRNDEDVEQLTRDLARVARYVADMATGDGEEKPTSEG